MLTTRDRRILSAIDVGSSAVLFALTLVLAREVATGGPQVLGVLRVDDLGLVFLLLLVVLTLAVSIYTVGWLRQAVEVGNMKAESLRSYFALVHAFVATMVVTVLADNLGVLWIAMEGTTITSAVLIGYHGHQHGLEAAWKYIIVTTIGCNACDWELAALLNPVYDVRRLGIDFVASPRHADGVVVTGPITRNLETAVRRTVEAVPDPRIVIAVGACAASGGIFGEGYASAGGVDRVLPVDVYIPGCPPRPEAILFGIMVAIGRLDARRLSREE